MDNYSCDTCAYSRPMLTNPLLKEEAKNGQDKGFQADNQNEYFNKYWCWCNHPDHNEPEFHRMRMRFLKREYCSSGNILYQETTE